MLNLSLLSRGGNELLLALFCLALLAAIATPSGADPVRVVVWDEQQPQQKVVYPNFLGNWITDYLKTRSGLTVKSVCLSDPEQGLSPSVLDQCDVLIWWGHQRHRDIKSETARNLVQRIKEGRLNLIALHSAHWSMPFVEVMHQRALEDALKKLPEGERAAAKIKLVYPKPFTVPRYDERLTPATQYRKKPSGEIEITLLLPSCVFPAYRADGKPSQIRTLLPQHPIARDIPAQFTIGHTEMYDEPFHVPEPDAVIFEERWDSGEWFRSGCMWQLGKGKVFYFRPGHEIYPVYKETMPLRILENAARWIGSRS
jgi:trehalose utilization protein